MFNILLIAAGGAAGAVSRYLVSLGITNTVPGAGTFPYGTLAVNLIGSFIIGIIWYISSVTIIPGSVRMLVFVGFLGAFTTFSTYSLESYSLFSSGETKAAVWNILLNNMGCILLVFAGILISKYLMGIFIHAK